MSGGAPVGHDDVATSLELVQIAHDLGVEERVLGQQRLVEITFRVVFESMSLEGDTGTSAHDPEVLNTGRGLVGVDATGVRAGSRS